MNNDNPNYHSAGKTVFDESVKDAKFADYRRQWSENPRDSIVAPAPLHVDIESTNVCNLRCPYCASAVHNWGDKGGGFIDFDLFRKVIDEAADIGVYCVKFSLRGEPLLHPRIAEMVEYAMKSGIIDCYFNTNGTLLTPDVAQALMQAGLPRISISIDGWDKASFDGFRNGADYDVVCENIRNLLAMRSEFNGKPSVRVQTVMLSGIREHWDEYVAHWSELADEVGFLDARDEGRECDHTGIVCEEFKCPFLWQRMTVLWDGTLLPCLMHGVREFSTMAFGNVRDLSIKETWHSARENEYRELHKAGRSHELAGCDQCSYRAAEIAKIG